MDEGGHEKIEGRRFGQYELERMLGLGAMGEVYLAKDRALDRLVAVKVLGAAFARDSDLIQRFQREAQAVARLNHPNPGFPIWKSHLQIRRHRLTL
jgi:serine/threonine-protein kinase